MKISNLDNFYEWTEGRIIDLLDTFSHGKFEERVPNTGISLQDLTRHMIIKFEFYFHWVNKEKLNEIVKEI